MHDFSCKYAVRKKKKSRVRRFFMTYFVSLHTESTVSARRWYLRMREESPGSTGRPTSENRSYW